MLRRNAPKRVGPFVPNDNKICMVQGRVISSSRPVTAQREVSLSFGQAAGGFL